MALVLFPGHSLVSDLYPDRVAGERHRMGHSSADSRCEGSPTMAVEDIGLGLLHSRLALTGLWRDRSGWRRAYPGGLVEVQQLPVASHA